MTVEFDTKKISAMLQDFYNATGIDMDLLKADFTPASGHRLRNNCYCSLVQSTPSGRKACQASDARLLQQCAATGQAQTHLCHAGLVDVAMPILYDGIVLGYIIFGRMRPNRDFTALESYISQLGLSPEEADAAYGQIPFFDEEKIHSLSNIATLIVKYILLEKMLTPKAVGGTEAAAAYIRENLHRELSIQEICRGTNLSKTMLYDLFRKRFGCTIGGYINAQRVERSKDFLKGSDLTMEEISQRIGFSSASYYSKIFKKHTGLSPLQYRKQQKEAHS